MSDWITILEERVQDKQLLEKFYDSSEFTEAFLKWDSTENPECYGND